MLIRNKSKLHNSQISWPQFIENHSERPSYSLNCVIIPFSFAPGLAFPVTGVNNQLTLSERPLKLSVDVMSYNINRQRWRQWWQPTRFCTLLCRMMRVYFVVFKTQLSRALNPSWHQSNWASAPFENVIHTFVRRDRISGVLNNESVTLLTVFLLSPNRSKECTARCDRTSFRSRSFSLFKADSI